MQTIFAGTTGRLGPATPQDLIYHSAGFFEAAKRSEHQVEIPNSNPPMFTSPLPPAITCYAFCAEVALKAFLLLETGGIVPGHKLDLLFEALSAQSKESVRSQFCLYTKRKPDDVDKGLPLLASTFVDWRYLYEKAGVMQVDVGFLRSFAVSVVMAVRKTDSKIAVPIGMEGYFPTL